MNNKTFIRKILKTVIGYKPMNATLIFLYAASLSGDCKVTPMLI